MTMSNDSVEQFYQRVIQDPSLQDRFKTAVDEAAALDLAVEIGQEQGLNFTSSDVKTWLASQNQNSAVELQDSDLETVSGGGPLTYSPLVALPPIVQ
jgi:predicted ribosomally synthesized peptide with nif11-like leader